ncbi:homoserine O-acetyltransferase [Planctomycetota bacterium]|nr:homoserine O-acetyltransferase [Planctomycetota bacterium]
MPLPLFHGGSLAPVTLEYHTWGQPNASRSNAILVCHSFSSDALAAGVDGQASAHWRPWRLGRAGWWDALIGPGKALDTDRYWVICCAVLGGSGGTTGPGSPIFPLDADGRDTSGRESPWGQRFPRLAIADLVASQRRLLDQLDVRQLQLVAGGSLGGLQALLWALTGGERVAATAIIAAAPRASVSGRAHFQAAQAAILDELKAGGDGLTALHGARAAAHRYSGPVDGGEPGQPPDPAEWPSDRFHPISYLRLAQALLDFDAGREAGADSLAEACGRVRGRVLIAPYVGDRLFPPTAALGLHAALLRAGVDADAQVLKGNAGHDSFLRNPRQLAPLLGGLLDGRGLFTSSRAA